MSNKEHGAGGRLGKLLDRTRPAAAECARQPVTAAKFGRRASKRPALNHVLTEEERIWMALLAGN